MRDPDAKLHALIHEATRRGFVLQEIARASGLSTSVVALAQPRQHNGARVLSSNRARIAAQKLEEALR